MNSAHRLSAVIAVIGLLASSPFEWSAAFASSSVASGNMSFQTPVIPVQRLANTPPPVMPTMVVPISIVAAGDWADGVPPIMAVYADGKLLTTTSITAKNGLNNKQTVRLMAFPSPSKIELAFTNDYYGNGQDRNLYIYSMTVGTTSYSPSQATFDYGSTNWSDSSATGPGGVAMFASGKLVFVVNSATTAPLAACGTTPSGSTVNSVWGTTNGSSAVTLSQCPYGATQPTTTTTTQLQLCTNGVLSNQGTPVTTTVNTGTPTCNAPAPCGATPSGSTINSVWGTVTGSVAATTAQCPFGGTQPTTTTTTQLQLCTNGVLFNQGTPVTTTENSGTPTCNVAAACGTTPSGATITQTVSTIRRSIAATTTQCPSGGTQATTTTVTQTELCTNGTLTNQGSPVTTTVNSGSPSCTTPTTSAITLPEVAPPPVSPTAIVYYVSSTAGNDGNDGLSTAKPFQHIAAATNNPAFKAGDIIRVMPGTYYETAFLSTSGTPSGYTIFEAMPGDTRPVIVSSPTLYAAGWGGPQFGSAISIRGNYIRVSGFDVSWWYDPATPGIYGNAIGDCCGTPPIDGIDQPTVHHVFIDNNIIHDSPAGGISLDHADYLTIANNLVYGNANWAPNETSGISLYSSTDFDNAPGFHTIIMNNVTYNNFNYVASNYTLPNGTVESFGCTTDGNGIIIDSNRHQDSDNQAYKSATLILGNLSFANGGRGIHMLESDNIAVINNTTWHNLQDPNACVPNQQGELSASSVGNVTFINNIADSAGVANAVVESKTTGDLWDHNMFFGGGLAITGGSTTVLDSSNLNGIDPQFVSPALAIAAANFRLQSTSQALGIGKTFSTSQSDLAGNVAKPGTPVDLGAYYQ